MLPLFRFLSYREAQERYKGGFSYGRRFQAPHYHGISLPAPPFVLGSISASSLVGERYGSVTKSVTAKNYWRGYSHVSLCPLLRPSTMIYFLS